MLDLFSSGCGNKNVIGVGRSLAVQARGLPLERYDEAVHNPFRVGEVTYRVSPQADVVRHSESAIDAKGQVLAEMIAPITIAIGSGQNGRAFFQAKKAFQTLIGLVPSQAEELRLWFTQQIR
jgi:hypothetical protein